MNPENIAIKHPISVHARKYAILDPFLIEKRNPAEDMEMIKIARLRILIWSNRIHSIINSNQIIRSVVMKNKLT